MDFQIELFSELEQDVFYAHENKKKYKVVSINAFANELKQELLAIFPNFEYMTFCGINLMIFKKDKKGKTIINNQTYKYDTYDYCEGIFKLYYKMPDEEYNKASKLNRQLFEVMNLIAIYENDKDNDNDPIDYC